MNNRMGRSRQIALHARCIVRGGGLRWHMAGIFRAVYSWLGIALAIGLIWLWLSIFFIIGEAMK